MKKRIIISVFILPVILISGCGKKADNADPLYVGYWWASTPEYNYTLIIKDNSDATYTISSGLLNSTEYKGKARISGDNLKIGYKKFHIDKEPSVSECGACTMILDGVELQQ